MNYTNIVIEPDGTITVEREKRIVRTPDRRGQTYNLSKMSAKNKALFSKLLNLWMWEYDTYFDENMVATNYLYTTEPVTRKRDPKLLQVLRGGKE